METTSTFDYQESDFVWETNSWRDGGEFQLTKFDRELTRLWDQAMAAGVFRYTLDHVITRPLPGGRGYVGQVNELRGTERRRPHKFESVSQKFNPDLFNFTMLKSREILFDVRNTTPCGAEEGGQPEVKSREGKQLEGKSKEKEQPKRTCDKSVREINNNISVPENGRDKDMKEPLVSQKTVCNRLVINISPIWPGHSLLVPDVGGCHPQVMTESSIQLALEVMLLSGHRGFRIGFNSLCALASINHHHYHVFYTTYELLVDNCPATPIAGGIFEFTSHPCPAFAIQLEGSTLQKMASLAYRISSYFHRHEIAHNMTICRGAPFMDRENSGASDSGDGGANAGIGGGDSGGTSSTIRIFMWPRRKVIGDKPPKGFHVACAELSGHCIVTDDTSIHVLTQEKCDDAMAAAALPADEYERVRAAVTEIGLEEEVKDGSTRHEP